MYGVGLSVLFTIAMLLAFRDQGAEAPEVFGVGLMVLCPVGALWAFFYYEHFARRHYARMRNAAERQKKQD